MLGYTLSNIKHHSGAGQAALGLFGVLIQALWCFLSNVPMTANEDNDGGVGGELCKYLKNGYIPLKTT